jgi:hypothetical protein
MLHSACDVKCTAAVRIGAVDARALAIIAKTARLFETLSIHLKVVDRFASLAKAEKTLGDPQRAREVRPSPISGTLHEAAALRAEHTPVGLVGATPRARIAGPGDASAESLGRLARQRRAIAVAMHHHAARIALQKNEKMLSDVSGKRSEKCKRVMRVPLAEGASSSKPVQTSGRVQTARPRRTRSKLQSNRLQRRDDCGAAFVAIADRSSLRRSLMPWLQMSQRKACESPTVLAPIAAEAVCGGLKTAAAAPIGFQNLSNLAGPSTSVHAPSPQSNYRTVHIHHVLIDSGERGLPNRGHRDNHPHRARCSCTRARARGDYCSPASPHRQAQKGARLGQQYSRQ